MNYSIKLFNDRDCVFAKADGEIFPSNRGEE